MVSRNLQILTLIGFGCTTLISATVKITPSYTGDGDGFAEGSNATLNCTISPYSGYQEWKVESVSVADCGFLSCNENLSNPERYSFMPNRTTGIFIFTISDVKITDNETVIECFGGSITDTDTFTIIVLIGPFPGPGPDCLFDDCCILLIVAGSVLLIHIVLGLLLFVTWKGRDNSTEDKYFASAFEYLIVLCVLLWIVMFAIYIRLLVICFEGDCLCSKIVRVVGIIFLALIGIHIVLGGILLYVLYCRTGTVSGKDEKCSTSNASCIRSICSAIPVAGLFAVCQWLMSLCCSERREPDPPTEFTLIDRSVTDTYFRLKWKPCLDGGYPQTFILTYKVNERVWRDSVEYSGQGEMQHTSRDLSKGTYYSVTIFAQNDVGKSSPVGPLYVRTKGHGVPYQPTDFKIVKVTKSSVTVQWKPGNNGGYAQKFILKKSEEETVVTQNDEHDTTMSYIFQNLSVENKYQLIIFAYNIQGSAPPIYIWTKSKPNKPTDFKLDKNSVTESSITVQWKQGFDGGFPQTFILCYEGNGNTDRVSVPDETREDTMTHTFENLAKGTEYTISILATNQEGDSLQQDPLVVKTKDKFQHAVLPNIYEMTNKGVQLPVSEKEHEYMKISKHFSEELRNVASASSVVIETDNKESSKSNNSTRADRKTVLPNNTAGVSSIVRNMNSSNNGARHTDSSSRTKKKKIDRRISPHEDITQNKADNQLNSPEVDNSSHHSKKSLNAEEHTTKSDTSTMTRALSANFTDNNDNTTEVSGDSSETSKGESTTYSKM